MKITVDAIIPITDATKHFKDACQKTKNLGTTFIFKNNKPDIVMMDMEHYSRLMSLLDDIEHSEIHKVVEARKATDTGKRYTLDEL